MTDQKRIGWLLIAGSIGVFIPYIIYKDGWNDRFTLDTMLFYSQRSAYHAICIIIKN